MDDFYNQEATRYEESQVDLYLVCGLSKGSVIFIAVHQPDQIYARFSTHKKAITSIEELHEHQKFVTISEEDLEICLWGFKDHRL